MRIVAIFMLVVFTSCSIIPFVVEEVEEAVEFEEDAIKHEIQFRETHDKNEKKTSPKEAAVQNN